MNEAFRHDDDIPSSAMLEVKVMASRSYLETLLAKNVDDKWIELTGEGVMVIVEISPDGWRGLGHAFSKDPTEPEWRLANTMLPHTNSAGTVWSERRPLEQARELG